jgi:drug/metabolite transporter (DMT)-like permease
MVAHTATAPSGDSRSGTVKAFGAVAAWYVSTVVLITMNKVLMREHFRLPVFLTFLHMLVSYAWCEFSAELGWGVRAPLKTRADAAKVFVLAQTLAVSVVLAVASFKYVEVSLEQALAASTPAFTACAGVVILGKRERSRVWLTLVPVVGGAAMSAGGDPKFHALGVALVVVSNVARATKSCMQEMLLNKETALDSMNLLRWMSLFSMATLFPMALVLEGGTEIVERLSYVYNDRTLGAALVANCTGAFMVNLSQFMVTAHVGALSMQVLGNLKNVFTSSVSVVVFQNAITAQGVVGYAITMLGAFAFGREKHRDRIAAAEAKAQSVGEQESEAGDATNKL